MAKPFKLDFTKAALLIVDVQNDFMPWGSLPVPHGDTIVPVIQRLFQLPFKAKIAVRDWHPREHCSFASRWNKAVGESIKLNGVTQKLWPDHCVQGSWGADFAPGIQELPFDRRFEKGNDHDIDSYSAFFNAQKATSTGVEAFLVEREISTVVLAGLTFEYCVYTSALHALELGHTVYLAHDGIQAIDELSKLTKDRIREMIDRGAKVIESGSLLDLQLQVMG